jgi:hypothetical protein
MQALRRHRLSQLLQGAFRGDRAALLRRSGLSKGRLSQLLDPAQPFGERAARQLEKRLRLEPGHLDSMSPDTVQWAVRFEALSPEMRARWGQLVELLAPIEIPTDPTAPRPRNHQEPPNV